MFTNDEDRISSQEPVIAQEGRLTAQTFLRVFFGASDEDTPSLTILKVGHLLTSKPGIRHHDELKR